MRQTPCELMLWNGLPVIRREIAASMITKCGLNQKETAQKLGCTPAAVCQYISKKRGKIEIMDQMIIDEINVSAERIIKNDGDSIIKETCRICKLMRNKGVFPFSCMLCEDEE